MRILITGGAGFIGSHLAHHFANQEHEICILDDLSRGKRQHVPLGAELVVTDIHSSLCSQTIARFRPQVIFHFAAQMDVRYSVAHPVLDGHINVLGTIHLLQAAVQNGCKTFIFASSGGAIYGEQNTFPAAESHAIQPTSPYGLSKYCAEEYLAYYSRAHSLRTVALRLANVYGPRQDPHGEAGVVAIFSQRMLQQQQPTIFGSGKQTRDYVHVSDVVQAAGRVLDTPLAHGAYNIGTGCETDLNALAAQLAEHCHFTGSLAYAAAKPGEQMRSVLDTSKAQQELRWKPQHTLRAGLEQTVAWFREQANPSKQADTAHKTNATPHPTPCVASATPAATP